MAESKEESEIVTFRLERSFLAELDAWCERMQVNRSDGIRHILKEGLYGPGWSLAETAGNLQRSMDNLLATHGLRVVIQPREEAPKQ